MILYAKEGLLVKCFLILLLVVLLLFFNKFSRKKRRKSKTELFCKIPSKRGERLHANHKLTREPGWDS
jgi:hypothetical protein